ncbi:MAG: hypothetical protein HC896_14845 [Bacteroidales bacterium]|nr:hypothetical protein [Bacteroidales bacterium]
MCQDIYLGLGFYNLKVNEHDVTPSGLNPAFTDYTKKVLYNTFDIAPMLAKGSNNLYGWFGQWLLQRRNNC